MTQRPRVCLIVTSDVSASAFYRGYPAYLRSQGWDVVLIASSTGLLQPLAEEEGVTAVSLPMRRDPAPLHDLVSLLRVIRLLRRLKPAVLVAATPKASLLGMLAARILRVPVRVYQLWGLRLETERGARRTLFRLLETMTVRSATVVVANSPSLAQAMRSEGIAGTYVVLGSGSATGLDLDRFDRSAAMPEVDASSRAFLDREPEAFTVGFVGRINRDKGIETLLEAAAIVLAGGVRLRLLIVGPTESADLEAKVAEAGARLPIHRAMSVSDPRPYFLAMDVHCLPTLREGFPNVVLEAAALGVPTVTTDATGARDSVVDGVTGMIVPTGDAAALAAALIRCAESPELTARLASAARQRVVDEFDQRRVWALHESFLRDRLEGRPA